MWSHPIFRWGAPPDAVAWCALVLGLVLLVVRGEPFSRAIARPTRSRLWLGCLALSAAALSAAYYAVYLGGAPRVIDAAAYLLEGRTFARGSFTFTPPEPTSLFRGRFVIHGVSDPLRVGAIFPPGYPALLALGEWCASYRVVGPLLAAGLVFATFALAQRAHADRSESEKNRIAFVAATFSVLCACLRYQTADTMSHGFSALLGTLLALFVLALAEPRFSRPSLPLFGRAFVFGLLAGALVATRQLTGAVFLAICAVSLALRSAEARSRSGHGVVLAGLALGLLPGLVLLAAHHHALTGDFWLSPQLRYYALADGPPGCFGLGFGKGCHFEHADVIAKHGGGLSFVSAAQNTLRRLHAHSLDLGNCELLVIAAVVGVLRSRREVATRLYLALFAALSLSYAFFYFDGTYPGGGARFTSELLPFGHVLLARGLVELGRVRVGFSLSLLGFALHASLSHEHLRTKMHGAAALAASGPRVTFTASDAIFLGGFEPRLLPQPGEPLRGRLVVRRSFDRREAALLAALGDPPAFVLDPNTLEERPWVPPRLDERSKDPKRAPLVLEAESDWPPLALENAWVHPSYPPGSCVSLGRGLRLHPLDERAQIRVTLEASGVPPGRYLARAITWSPGTECSAADLGAFELPAPLVVTLPAHAPSPDWHLDRIELVPADAPSAASPSSAGSGIFR